MKDAGLTTWVDEAGNTFGRLGEGAPTVMTGSHIDTVPQGGSLDGALGVLAGLECLHTLRESNVRTRRPLTVAAWSDEEGRYASLFGSKAFTGKLDTRQTPYFPLRRREARWTRWRARASIPLEAPKAKCDPKTLAAYVELHIEQGPHLEAARLPIGSVEGIVASARLGHLHRPGRPRGHHAHEWRKRRLPRGPPSTPWPRASWWWKRGGGKRA